MTCEQWDVVVVPFPFADRAASRRRPALVVSPDEINAYINTVIIAPMTTKGRNYPTRVPCTFQGKSGQVVLDQIRTVDQARLVKRLGKIDGTTADTVLDTLAELFAK